MTAGVLEWLTATLDAVERGIRAEPHDATPDDYGMERCDLAGPHVIADDTCTCGLDIRQPIALASVEADRAIAAAARDAWHHYQEELDDGGGRKYDDSGLEDHRGRWEQWERAVLLTASRYRHRPGWRPEWAPAEVSG